MFASPCLVDSPAGPGQDGCDRPGPASWKEHVMSASLSEKLRSFDPDLPLERAHTIPSWWYADPEIYAAECRAVFGATWQAVGRVDQVPERGTFFTANLAGEPL